jgi:ABC-2 type transport system permease protein
VTSENTPVLYNITGHDELSLDDSFSSAVSKANIDLQTINLMDYDSVPEDADIVLINAPTSDFSSDDAQKIKDYMAAGGKAIVITGYTDQDMTNFNSILSEYGVTLYDGIVAENSTSNYYQTPFYLLPNVEYCDYTEGIRGSKYIFAPYALGMRVAAEDDTLTVTDILTTSEQAVTKNDLENMTSYSAEDGDETGTFEVGVQVTKTEDSGTSQLFVFTSENLFTDSANQMVSGANLQLFTNVTGSLIDTEVTVSIPVKEVSQETLTVAQNYFLLIGLFTTLVLPIALLVAGIVIWVRRRRR